MNERSEQSGRTDCGSSPLLSGLSVRPDDCPVTRSVRAALYATDLQPTEDDVIGLVISIKEDLIDPIYDRLTVMREEATAARRESWDRRDSDPMPHRHYGREQALSQALGVIEDLAR